MHACVRVCVRARENGVKNEIQYVSLTVNRLHQTDSHLMSLMRFPPGNRNMMFELLCVCSGGGSLRNNNNKDSIYIYYTLLFYNRNILHGYI